MKNREINYTGRTKHHLWKTTILLFGLFFIFTNCENDTDMFIKKDSLINLQKAVIVEQVIINDIPAIANLINGLSYQAKRMNDRKENSSFSIDTERIIQATDSIGNITYAFEILTIDEPDNILYNLIVTQRVDGKEIPAFIIKYEFENATKYDYATPTEELKFKAKTSIYSYESFLQTGTIQSKGTANSKATSSGTNPCVEIDNTTNSSSGGGGGNNHMNGGNFTEQTSNIGGIGGFGVYNVPSSGGGGGGGSKGKVICGELIMLGNKVNSLNKNQNTKTQSKGTTEPGPCPQGEILLPVNKTPYKIINKLTGKADCAYDYLLKSGVRNPHNLITDLFIEFGDGNIGSNDLTFKMATDLPLTVGGETKLDNDGNFQILINANLMNTLSSIEVAAIIVHEISHAFLGKHYNNSYSSFKDLYSQYINDKGLGNYSHDIMNDQFINRMANVLQNYDNQIFSNFEDYKTLASQGVFDLTSSQKSALNAVKTKARNNDTKCKG